jgi:hypothetical protein
MGFANITNLLYSSDGTSDLSKFTHSGKDCYLAREFIHKEQFLTLGVGLHGNEKVGLKHSQITYILSLLLDM